MSTDSDGRTTVELYLSTGTTTEWNRQQDVIERLERAEFQDVIDHFSVQMWAKTVSVSGPMADSKFHRAAVRAVDDFESWAESVERDVELPTERETVSCEMTGNEYRLLRTPSICAAVYDDSDLSAVYPCTVAGRSTTVDDFLDQLEAGEVPAVTTPSGPRAVESHE